MVSVGEDMYDDIDSDCYFTALYRARQAVDDFGTIVRILQPAYSQAVQFYLY